MMYIDKSRTSWVNTKKAENNLNLSSKKSLKSEDSDRIFHFEDELRAPIAKMDMEEFFDYINADDYETETTQLDNSNDTNNNCSNSMNKNRSNSSAKLNTNLVDTIDLCNSLEDLVKTFDQNVKSCLSNYNEIDIGQLAPVQVRSQEDIINDSQIWYTLTGNFGNLLPIDYWSKSLVRKYHKDSLNIKSESIKCTTKKASHKQFLTRPNANDRFNNTNSDDLFNSYDDYFDFNHEANDLDNDVDDDFERESSSNNDNSKQSECSFKTNSLNYDSIFDEENELSNEQTDSLDYDEDEDELREQLDMHSMILSKSVYNDNGDDLDEPIITAEQVLNEIESMMTMQEEYYDEMTPDSGCFSMFGLSTLNSSYCSQNGDLPNELNGSYLKYINTFAMHTNATSLTDNNESININNQIESTSSGSNNVQLVQSVTFMPSKNELKNLNMYELNELIEQIETNTKELSDTLVQELASRDELEFEKETRNTFISLLMSIQDKKRQLNSDNLISSHHHHNHNHHHHHGKHSNSNKKKNRRSLINLDNSKTTHLTTIIPYNNEIEYTVQHLQILNKLLKAINEDSHQVPEFLTNYILKVVCPT